MIPLQQFALAGRAVFTVESPTGVRFTYRVAAKRDGSVHYVSVLTGPDNTADYEYLGAILPGGEYRHGRSSRIEPMAPSARAFDWIWRHRANPAPAQVHHEGRCCRCGRALTVPESVTSGIGPECAKMAGAA